jgi:phosphoglycolate phosphatase-like HAD superfamily hydrolase
VTRVFLFDIDGTLVLTGGSGMRALERATFELSGVEGATLHILADGKTDPLLAAEIAAALPAHHGAAPDFADRLFACYLGHLAAEVAETPRYEILPGVAAALDALDAAALPYGLATGNIEAAARIKLHRGDLWRRFPFGGYGSDSGERHELVARAISRGSEHLGRSVAADAVVVIGDTPRDIQAAHANGAKCIGVATGRYSTAELSAAGADWALETLEAFPEWLSTSP